MEHEIFTQSIQLHINNKILPPLTIQEADNYLHELCEWLKTEQSITVVVEIVFTDGLKITETFTLTKNDLLLDGIIRYHMVGIIRFKAGLLKSSIYPEKYQHSLADVDTEFYKKLFCNYSFFYTSKKLRRGKSGSDALKKLRTKYTKLKKKDAERIKELQLNVSFYDGVLAGIDTPVDLKQAVLAKNTAELAFFKAGTAKHSHITGVLEGLQIVGGLLLCFCPPLTVFSNINLL